MLRSHDSAGDMAVRTPWYESFGLTPMEGTACGGPVMSSALGGISFTVEDGVTGLLVRPPDPVALANALRHLLEQPEQRAAMGDAAREHVEHEFT